jgi:uncharacterized protein
MRITDDKDSGRWYTSIMNSETIPASPAAPPRAPINVRWTVGDLLLVAAVAALLGVGVLLSFRLLASLGLTALRDLATEQPLAGAMVAGGMLYGLFALAVYLVVVRRGRGSWQELGFRAPSLLVLLLTPLIFPIQLMLAGLANFVVQNIAGTFENPQIAALIDPDGFSWLNFALVFVVAAVIAPIVEELLFRGLLYQWLRARLGIAVAVVLSAAIFSVVHVIPLLFPALFLIGIVLALAFEYGRSLWVSIALHFFQNAFAVCVIFFIQANPQLIPG